MQIFTLQYIYHYQGANRAQARPQLAPRLSARGYQRDCAVVAHTPADSAWTWALAINPPAGVVRLCTLSLSLAMHHQYYYLLHTQRLARGWMVPYYLPERERISVRPLCR